jgi:hypothetical protein
MSLKSTRCDSDTRFSTIVICWVALAPLARDPRVYSEAAQRTDPRDPQAAPAARAFDCDASLV